jgi:hypothetical protein
MPSGKVVLRMDIGNLRKSILYLASYGSLLTLMKVSSPFLNSLVDVTMDISLRCWKEKKTLKFGESFRNKKQAAFQCKTNTCRFEQVSRPDSGGGVAVRSLSFAPGGQLTFADHQWTNQRPHNLAYAWR